VVGAISFALLAVVAGAITAATGSRIVQYLILGAVIGSAILLIGVHSFVEAALRPVRSHSSVIRR
jgi:adenylate cyclase